MALLMDLPCGYRLMKLLKPGQSVKRQFKPLRWLMLGYPEHTGINEVLERMAKLDRSHELVYAVNMTPTGPALLALMGSLVPMEEFCIKSDVRTGFFVDNPDDITVLHLVCNVIDRKYAGNLSVEGSAKIPDSDQHIVTHRITLIPGH